jgi:hypothetical protein
MVSRLQVQPLTRIYTITDCLSAALCTWILTTTGATVSTKIGEDDSKTVGGIVTMVTYLDALSDYGSGISHISLHIQAAQSL